MPEPIACESRISRVVVYARGAVVTRRVELPAGLPNEPVDLHIDGVTPMAEPGSVRTHVDGERRVTGLQAPLVWPEGEQASDLWVKGTERHACPSRSQSRWSSS